MRFNVIYCLLSILGNVRYTSIHKLFWEEFIITKNKKTKKNKKQNKTKNKTKHWALNTCFTRIIKKRPKSNHMVMLAFGIQLCKREVVILHVYLKLKAYVL